MSKVMTKYGNKNGLACATVYLARAFLGGLVELHGRAHAAHILRAAGGGGKGAGLAFNA
jgi:hypothetical protein